MDHPTLPLRGRPRVRRMSREFLSQAPLTPQLERLHCMDTARLVAPRLAPLPPTPHDLDVEGPDDGATTGRIELDLAARLTLEYKRSWWLVIGGSTVVGLAAGFACMAALT